ncbi:hypothetical protein VTO42DRAFT_7897 [Malbranchea cinnamomea]
MSDGVTGINSGFRPKMEAYVESMEPRFHPVSRPPPCGEPCGEADDDTRLKYLGSFKLPVSNILQTKLLSTILTFMIRNEDPAR